MCIQKIAVFVLCLAGCYACGIEDDPFQCRDLCDAYSACDSTVSDVEWDFCHSQCTKKNFSREFVDCIIAKECMDDFEDQVQSCIFDPMNPDEEVQTSQFTTAP